MKKNIMTAFCIVTSIAAMGQETYENADLATKDLNGTARYIGMGGAMEALGADISTMGTNPAGIGLFRKSWAGVSAGITVQSNGGVPNAIGYDSSTLKDGRTNLDLNQVGFVYSTQTGSQSWLNFGINYHKSRNFSTIANATNSLDGYSSANMMSAIRAGYGMPLGMADEVNFIALNDYLTEKEIDPQTNEEVEYYYGRGAESYLGTKENRGHISQFDFNISGNVNHKLYLGLTLGLYDIRYKSSTLYDENLVDGNGQPGGVYTFLDERQVTGAGFDIKLGAIYRPVDDSPFRIGAYIHTPTWYDLECNIDMTAAANFDANSTLNRSYGSYKYKMYTPWKFGLSAGHTIGNYVALGATYEYADYSAIENRIVFSDNYDVYEEDYQMNRHTEQSLRGVSTTKVGIEVKPVPEVAIRMGYNHVSPMYHTDAYKDITIDTSENGSNGAYFATHDYINWGETHRVTFGLGFALNKKATLDLSYQYSTQNGTYYPFASVYDRAQPLNVSNSSKIENNRHHINATLGYRF